MWCEVCRENTPGRTYIGKVSTTVTGRQCQHWSSNTPHEINAAFTDNGFPDGSAEAAENYCRNPDAQYEEGVWCYTTDSQTRWESCDVPKCGESFLLPDADAMLTRYIMLSSCVCVCLLHASMKTDKGTGSRKQRCTIGQRTSFLMSKILVKFEQGHPQRGTLMQVRQVKIGDFRQIAR